VALAVALLGALLAVLLWEKLRPRLPTDVRRDLLLDRANVLLISGFEGHARLETWTDTSASPLRDPDNPDRDEVALLAPRNGALRWSAQVTRPATLRLGVARLAAGPGADEAPCELLVTANGSTTRLPLPPAPADVFAPAGFLREGPAEQLTLELPQGLDSLQLELQGGPGYALLLAPHVVMAPQPVLAEELIVPVEHETRLLPLVTPGEPRFFATRRCAPQIDAGTDPLASRAAAEAAPREEVLLPAVEAVAAFTGPVRDARQALAFTGLTALKLVIDIPAGAVLRGALALDSRLPPDSRATFAVRVDGSPITQLEVPDAQWGEFEMPLDAHAGPGRTLELTVEEAFVPEGVAVEALEPDYARRHNVGALYEAAVARVGLADPRLVTTAALPRRVATSERPSVLLIQVETLRADALAPWAGVDGQDFGAPADLTPNLTRLAARAAVWRRNMAPSPWTVPSSASLLTGLPPQAHGATTMQRIGLPGDVATLAERVREVGAATGAVVSSDLLSEAAGYARGFESFAHVPYANARQVVTLAQAFLQNHAGQQFLLFLHLFDPHSPYAAPEPWRNRYVPEELRGRTIAEAEGRLLAGMERAVTGAGPALSPDDPDALFLRGRYLGEIAWWDEQLGRLLEVLDRLKLDDSTIVVITADHGEEFFEHGLYGHGSNVHEETLRVPLLVAPPPGWRVALPVGPREEVVGTAALHASILEWMGVPFDADAVLPPLRRPTGWALSSTDKGLALVSEVDPLSRSLDSVRTDRLRAIVTWPVPGETDPARHEAFDLRADPAARVPLPDAASAGVFGLLEDAALWAAAHRAQAAPEGLSADQLETLKAFGYLGTGGAPQPPREVPPH
jgi:arylsulfatase A-like enzyme